MKHLFDDKDDWTAQAMEISRELEAILQPIVKKYVGILFIDN